MKKILRITIPLLVALMACCCSTVSKVGYLRDINPGEQMPVQDPVQLLLKPGDRLRIFVYSRDRELAELFNLSYGQSGANPQNSLQYTIDASGNIDMPIIGVMHVAGLTRIELATQIKYRLLSAKLLNDPTVIVDYANMAFFALGEVSRPGRIEIPKDELTILEAIALAGDLTINGRRDNVLVLRTHDGVQDSWLLDLTDTRSVYDSPAYYLQQNDIVYVEPNTQRANQSELMANQVRTPSFWFSTISGVTSVVLLILNLLGK